MAGSSSVRWPNGVAIDLVQDRIYWIDAKLNLVGSADLDGANSRFVSFVGRVREPYQLCTRQISC